MNEADWERLLNRVNMVEAQNRRFRRLGLAVAAIAVIALVAGQVRPSAAPRNVERLIEAERFVVKDKQGRTRALLGIEDDTENATLKLFDKSGDSILAATVADEFCGIGLYPARGPFAMILAKPDLASLTFRPQATLLAGLLPDAKAKADPILSTHGGDHKAEIGLFHDNPYVAIGDRNSRRGEWLVTDTGDAGFTVRDKAGKTRIELVVSDVQGTSLRIFDKAGVVRGTWGLEANDKFMLHALNDTEGVRGAWAVYRDGTTWIRLTDKTGNVIFSAP